MSKFVLPIILLIYNLLCFGCTRVVTLPVKTVVDWTEEDRLSTQSVHDLSKSSSD